MLHHGCSISLSTLKRWLRQENLVRHQTAGRRNLQRNIVNSVAEELGGSGSNIIYRKMHKYLQAIGMVCHRKDDKCNSYSEKASSTGKKENTATRQIRF